MKEYDKVEVLVDKKEYAKDHVFKGMRGVILYDKKSRDGCWLVYFSDKDGADTVSSAIHEEDLKIVE